MCVSVFSGGVRLCGQFFEERAEYPHCLHPLHVHLCCHRSSALQGKILLLHRWVQGPREGLQVGLKSPTPAFLILETFKLLTVKFWCGQNQTLYLSNPTQLYLCLHVFQRTVSRLRQRRGGCHAQRVEEIWVPLWQCAVGLPDPLHCLHWGGLANVCAADLIPFLSVETMHICDGLVNWKSRICLGSIHLTYVVNGSCWKRIKRQKLHLNIVMALERYSALQLTNLAY